MTRLISFLGFGIAAAALPQMAAAQSVTLDPGLYEVSEKVVMTFRPEKNKVEDVCISAGQNIKTLEGLIEAFTKRKDECQPRDIQQTARPCARISPARPCPRAGTLAAQLRLNMVLIV